MAQGSNYLTTYYAKRIIGDTAAANSGNGLLQSGAIASDMWIFSQNNRASAYGIKYVYDSTEGEDKVEFYGGGATATAWVQLDTGDAVFNEVTADLIGNADTATALATGRTLKVILSSNNASTAFDGSANVHDIGVDGVLGISNGGTNNNSFVENRVIFATTRTENNEAITYLNSSGIITEDGYSIQTGPEDKTITVQRYLTVAGASGRIALVSNPTSGFSYGRGLWANKTTQGGGGGYFVTLDEEAHATFYGSLSGNATSADYLSTYVATDSNTTKTILQALKNKFADIPKSVGTAIRVQIGSHAMALGYFLSGNSYNTINTAYGGWFVAAYDIPHYVGISNGTWTDSILLHSDNYTTYTVTKTGGGASGDWNINAATATKLSNTPNNTTTFLRGDNTWSSTLTGVLTLHREGTTANDNAAGIYFTNKDTTTNKSAGSYIYVYNDHAASSAGNNMVIYPAGTLILGGGEGPGGLYTAIKSTIGTGENCFIVSDGTTYVYSNSQTVANRVGFAVSTAGHILPQKAEAANNNAQNLGASNNKWANVYATTFTGNLTGNVTGNVTGNCSGSSGSCTGNAATATKFNSTRTIKLTGSVTGSATTDGGSGWEIATTTNHNHNKVVVAASNTAFTDTATVALNGISIRWYSTASSFTGQPSQYGFLVTMATGDSANELHQIFATQADGDLYHRGTNGSSHASPPAFKTLIDSSNWYRQIFTNKNKTRSTLTVTDSTWNVTAGTDLFGLSFKDTGLKYTPSGGSATASSDSGDWRAWLTCAAASNTVQLNMRIDGTWQASKFIGPLEGNADTATKATQDGSGNTITSTYLKLSGGTLTGNLFITTDSGDHYFEVKSNATGVRLELDNSGSTNHGLWSSGYWTGSEYKASSSWMIYRNSSGTNIVNGNCTGSSGSCTGNAATATNADKVDNYHAADLWRKDGGTWNGNANISCTPTANNQEYSFDLGNAYTGTYWHVWSGKNSKSILACYNDNMSVSIPNGTLSVGGHLMLTTAGKHLYMRYNSADYGVVYNHNNGNVSLRACGVGLYVGYADTTLVDFMAGRAQIKDGCLSLFPNNSSYREGLRIHATGNWSDITLCGNDNTGDSGISANSWFIGNNNGNFYIARNGSPGSTAYLSCVSNAWTFLNKVRIASTEDVGKNKNGALIIGNPDGENIAFDNNEMMARNNSAASTLYINSEGGLVYIGSGGLEITGNQTITGAGAHWTKWVNTTTGVSIEMWSDTTNQGIYTRGYWTGSAYTASAGWILYRGTDSYLHTQFRLYGAVWNDYAEFRKGDVTTPGRVVMEQRNGIMTLCNERLAAGAKIISDTYGFAIGETKECKTPIAVSGRVLVYPYRNRNEYELGAAVCSAPGGTIDIMTREEIKEYPERIIGTVSEIPEYEIWHCNGNAEQESTDEVKVDGRIWIYVK